MLLSIADLLRGPVVEFTYSVYIVVYSVGQRLGDAGTNYLQLLSRILVGESYSVLLLVGVAAFCFWLGRATGYYRTALPFDWVFAAFILIVVFLKILIKFGFHVSILYSIAFMPV